MSNLLYKYLDVKGAIMMLHYSNLMYANAMTFNDPLDCHPALIDFNNVPSRSNNVWPPDELIIKQNISRYENYRNFYGYVVYPKYMTEFFYGVITTSMRVYALA